MDGLKRANKLIRQGYYITVVIGLLFGFTIYRASTASTNAILFFNCGLAAIQLICLGIVIKALHTNYQTRKIWQEFERIHYEKDQS